MKDFWVVWTKDDRLNFYDFSKYFKKYHNFSLGGLSIAVPGEVRGLRDAWKRYGRLPWERLVQPAIDLARDGFEITEAVDDALEKFKQDIRKDTGLRSA